jgi:non-lysosomal glucosylceramidase
MKIFSLLAVLTLSLLELPLPASAGDLFNPVPATIESPRDSAALTRLTTNSDGRTPVVKNIDAGWIKALADRGTPTLYTKENSQNFAYLGMPTGGIGAGELYLSGDGQLWEWDIFGTQDPPGTFPVELGGAYAHPHKVGDPADSFQSVIDQGFVIRTKQDGKVDTRTLNKDGFSAITFSGQYPVGTVDYSDPGSPVHVRLEAFSPFIPGDVADSSYPATILNYTVENTSQKKIECMLGGWMENASGISIRNQVPLLLKNSVFKDQGSAGIEMGMDETPFHPPTSFGGLESGTYGEWTVEGDAFGKNPTKRDNTDGRGQYYINSYAIGGDKLTGKLTSKPFVIEQSYVTFRIQGGNGNPGTTPLLLENINLLVDGKIVQTATGGNDNAWREVNWDVRALKGKTAQLQIIDQSATWFGQIQIDDIAFADAPAAQTDVGNMALALLGDASGVAAQVTGAKSSDACLDAPALDSAEMNVPGNKDKLIGAVRRTVTLAPGEKKTISFIVAWYFPKPLPLNLSTPTSRQYGVRFKSAQDVVDHLAADFDRLSKATLAWRDNWYDSTLPYWFLDRTFLNSSTLATSTDYLLADGRFYGYEGRYSCPGTCAHVYGYQQAMGFLFPDLEKAIMEKVEFMPGLGMNPDGGIGMRAEFSGEPAVDGQSGLILRTYLAHRMSADDSFLKRNYASVKKAADYLVHSCDPAHAGILVGAQSNTMDAAWFGNNTWMSLYYQAALRATAEMADDSNDGDYARSLRAIADKGRTFIETQLFNGEYFFHQPDPAHPESPGTFNGCAIEQLMGQNWAYQVGLGDILDPAKVHTALDSIWKYDYTTDVGLYRNTFKPGRWFALPGEGALLMCTFPHGGEETLKKGIDWASAYVDETWAGSEYEIAGTMMWAGQVDKALAEVRTVRERYDGAKRNPWDEIECGSHYSRSMASYGVFTAACGFEYDGPKGTMAFAPRVNPENFKAAFTSAEGWGRFSQKYIGKELDAWVAMRYGKLRLHSLCLALPTGSQARGVKVQINGTSQTANFSQKSDRISINFPETASLKAGEKLEITVLAD